MIPLAVNLTTSVAKRNLIISLGVAATHLQLSHNDAFTVKTTIIHIANIVDSFEKYTIAGLHKSYE